MTGSHVGDQIDPTSGLGEEDHSEPVDFTLPPVSSSLISQGSDTDNDLLDLDDEFLSLLRGLGEDSDQDDSSDHQSDEEEVNINLEATDLLPPDQYSSLFDKVELQKEETREEDTDISLIEASFTNLKVEENLGISRLEVISEEEKEEEEEDNSTHSENSVGSLVDKLLKLPIPSADLPTSDANSYNDSNHNIDSDTEELQNLDFDILDTLVLPTDLGTDINDFDAGEMQSQINPTIAMSPAFLPKEAVPYVSSMRRKNNYHTDPQNERSCFGHKETIFGLSFSPCGKYLATAGQDSKIMVWNTEKNSLISTLTGHDVDHECLRVTWAPPKWGSSVLSRNDAQTNEENPDLVMASAGANGIVKIWRPDINTRSSKCFKTLDHSKPNFNCSSQYKDQTSEAEDDLDNLDDDEKQVPQVYALQFIDSWTGLIEGNRVNLLMTSSDDCIHFWELVQEQKLIPNICIEIGKSPSILHQTQTEFKKVLSFKFTDMNKGYGGVFVEFTPNNTPSTTMSNSASNLPQSFSDNPDNNQSSHTFGGDRNPQNLVFVFDASFCHATNLVAAALSDGTCRLVNTRGVCVSILELPGCNSHLTALAWDKRGERLTTCVATGHVILWSVDLGDGKGGVIPSCDAVLDGGHDRNRPLFGAVYCGGENDDLLLSWGVDGKLCLWDSHSRGELHSPIEILVSKPDYPIYAVGIVEFSNGNDSKSPLARIAVAGGRDAGFMGMPLFLYDISAPADEDKAT